MRFALAVLMALHGVAHLVGFAGSWRLPTPEPIPYKTTVLAGHPNLGNAGMRAMGVLWLLAAAAFVVAAGGALAHRDSWMAAATAVTVASLCLTVVAWPDSRIGVVVNVAILAGLTLGRARGWL